MINKKTLKGFVSGVIVTTLMISTVFATPVRKQLDAVYNNIKIIVNGIQVDPQDSNGQKVEPFIVAGTTYLPVRALAEALGQPVKWDAKNNTVVIGLEKTKSGNVGLVELTNSLKPFDGRLNERAIGNIHPITNDHFVEVRQDKYSTENAIFGNTGYWNQLGVSYLLKGKYAKMTGYIAVEDKYNSGSIQFHGDGRNLLDTEYYKNQHGTQTDSNGYFSFNSQRYTETVKLEKGMKPIPFEINLIGTDEFTIFATDGIVVFGVEFEPIK